MKITELLQDRVLIKPTAPVTKTGGGILIPDNAQERPKSGVVLLVGPGADGKAPIVEVGDTVMYGKYTGNDVESEGQALLVMRESDIICIVGF